MIAEEPTEETAKAALMECVRGRASRDQLAYMFGIDCVYIIDLVCTGRNETLVLKRETPHRVRVGIEKRLEDWRYTRILLGNSGEPTDNIV